MAKGRSSRGLLVSPAATPNMSSERRLAWLNAASAHFVAHSEANRRYYRVILEALWPEGHGIPGPTVSQDELRTAVDNYRSSRGEPAYKDVFRRVRELQGEEGFTSIVKEGVRYQLQSLQTSAKREPRAKPPPAMWRRIQKASDYRCTHCGRQVPEVTLSPDHRIPRSRGGSNDEGNWQPLCDQCNVLKSSACQGCGLNCMTCSWAYPETYKPIQIDDDNKELIRRAAEKQRVHQSDLVNVILRRYFNEN